MSSTVAAKRGAFWELHRDGCFVLPNPWDVASARRLAGFGFHALASTSYGAALAAGRKDGELSVDEVLDHLRLLVEATELPVSADFEAGFADEPEGVAANVTRAVQTGVAGLSIEDRTGPELYDAALAVERVRAARAAIDATGEDVVLIARTEGFLIGLDDLKPTIDRMVAMAEAGADCLFAPGLAADDDIAALVRAVAPKPVNVLLWGAGMTVRGLADLGVRRVSTGGALSRLAPEAFEAACRSLLAGGGIG